MKIDVGRNSQVCFGLGTKCTIWDVGGHRILNVTFRTKPDSLLWAGNHNEKLSVEGPTMLHISVVGRTRKCGWVFAAPPGARISRNCILKFFNIKNRSRYPVHRHSPVPGYTGIARYLGIPVYPGTRVYRYTPVPGYTGIPRYPGILVYPGPPARPENREKHEKHGKTVKNSEKQ